MPSLKIIELLVPMKTILKVLAKYGHGGHLGHVTETIFINSCPSSFSGRLHIKFDFDIAVSEKTMFENNVHIHALTPRTWVDNPLMSFVSKA